MTLALEPHAIATLAIAGVAFALFARERIPIETTSLGVLVLLAAGFHLFPYTRGGVTVTPADFFLGFGHEALVTFCFVTPMAYQTNLLVMSAGGYRFSDFVRGGLPLLALMLVSYALLLPRFFPL
jgi:hypothetical protein